MPNKPSLTEFDTTSVFTEGVATIISQKCILWDYNGHRPGEPEVPAMQIEFQAANGAVSEEFLTAGSQDDFIPAEDGKSFVLAGSKTKFHAKSKLGALLLSMIEKGVPKKSLNPENYDCIVGISGHLSTIVLIKAGGNIEKDVTALVFDKIVSLPGAKAKSGKKKVVDEEIDALAVEVLKSVLTDNDDLPRKSLMGKAITNEVLKSLEKSEKTQVIKRFKDDEFLALEAGWTIDANVLSLAKDAKSMVILHNGNVGI